jgi:hypothetical protein
MPCKSGREREGFLCPFVFYDYAKGGGQEANVVFELAPMNTFQATYMEVTLNCP